jgi:uncharacterized protein
MLEWTYARQTVRTAAGGTSKTHINKEHPMDSQQLLAERREKDEFFKASAYAPLTPEQQARFTHLSYYDPNPALDLVVTVEPFTEPGDTVFETTTGDHQHYRRYGQFTFAVDGHEVRLTLYSGPHGYFLPFVDANAGQDTYSAGRYLEPEPMGNNRFHVDFNLAYNPYCAYGPGWSCPLTPAENRLNIPVRAGEKLPEGAWVNYA